MPRFLIERTVGTLTPEQIEAGSRRSIEVLARCPTSSGSGRMYSDVEGKIYCEVRGAERRGHPRAREAGGPARRSHPGDLARTQSGDVPMSADVDRTTARAGEVTGLLAQAGQPTACGRRPPHVDSLRRAAAHRPPPAARRTAGPHARHVRAGPRGVCEARRTRPFELAEPRALPGGRRAGDAAGTGGPRGWPPRTEAGRPAPQGLTGRRSAPDRLSLSRCSLALDTALHRLEQIDPRLSRVVECRYFGGMSVEEAAEALQVSPATIKRDWSVARAWLNRELRG